MIEVICASCGNKVAKPDRQVRRAERAGYRLYCNKDCAAVGHRMTDAEFLGLITPEPNSGCWLWLGATNPDGYGKIGSDRAHHRMLRLAGRNVPPGLEVNHRCRIPCCVNPDHLEIVTHRQNVLYGHGVAYENARKTHCPKGHPYDDSNTQIVRGVWRQCRKCKRDRMKASGHYNDRAPHVERNCASCGAPFRARKSNVDKGMGRFCGRACQLRHLHETKRAGRAPVLAMKVLGG